MNLLLFTEKDRLDSGRITVRGKRLAHLRQVQELGTGDRLRVGEINGLIGEGVIEDSSDECAVIAIELSQTPPPKTPLTLVLALPRPKMLRRILRSVAQLGVAELHLINSYRVEKSYWQSPLLADAALESYLLQGLEQSIDTRLPLVACHKRFKPFAEDTLPGMIEDKRGLLAHPGDYPPCPQWVSTKTLLAVGPEGGFTPYEAEKLEQAGCQPVSLGPRILRVETAVTALLGRLAIP